MIMRAKRARKLVRQAKSLPLSQLVSLLFENIRILANSGKTKYFLSISDNQKYRWVKSNIDVLKSLGYSVAEYETIIIISWEEVSHD